MIGAAGPAPLKQRGAITAVGCALFETNGSDGAERDQLATDWIRGFEIYLNPHDGFWRSWARWNPWKVSYNLPVDVEVQNRLDRAGYGREVLERRSRRNLAAGEVLPSGFGREKHESRGKIKLETSGIKFGIIRTLISANL
ncbi:hypothetical protein M5K25_005397 [Dendrobium thyrsiflorum]|uniref:Uncharacterized protein n=1 Tax=Dendrobium thyrsiflorum TaxID=117978 RepID=A0ABD0VHF4_DENTH